MWQLILGVETINACCGGKGGEGAGGFRSHRCRGLLLSC